MQLASNVIQYITKNNYYNREYKISWIVERFLEDESDKYHSYTNYL